MKKALPANAKISKDAKETVQECVSEFISFVTGEASDKCQREKRKTINGDDLLWAMTTLGFEDYVEPLKVYLAKYRARSRARRPPPSAVTTQTRKAAPAEPPPPPPDLTGEGIRDRCTALVTDGDSDGGGGGRVVWEICVVEKPLWGQLKHPKQLRKYKAGVFL
ncbi:nuclear factor Y, subunit B3 [Actinidia rufa]|uniref:Nuclear factor Y, subunit B3 n=1 Tax=Actinidia rufa TaxID=165716 RepID=A0A7J0G9S2_9ERIC|nr:nuclear factor Y, subunit B3 [Actinidia rufa]